MLQRFAPTLSFCREEVRLLREELTEEYEADKQAALTQLSQQKELEMMAAREGWQRKVEDLLEQVQHIAIKLLLLYGVFQRVLPLETISWC